MNKTFAFPRFWNYFKYDLAQFWRKDGVMVLIVGLFSYIGLSSLLPEIPSISDDQGLIRAVSLILSILLFSLCNAWTYRQLRRPAAGTAFVLLPASALEKYISMLIIILLITPFAYSLLLLSSDAVYSWITGQQNIISLTNELVGMLKYEAGREEMKLGLIILSGPFCIYTLFSMLSLFLGTFSKYGERVLLVLIYLLASYPLKKIWGPQNGDIMHDLTSILAQSATLFVVLLAALWFRLKTIRY